MRLAIRDCVPALAKATFREALRDRILMVVVLFALAVFLFSRVLGWLSVEDEAKMVRDYSLSGLSLLGLLLAMLVGAFTLAKEVERRTACTILTRDIGRGEFILAKYLGLVSVFSCCLAGAFAVLVLWTIIGGGHFDVALFAAILGILFECLLLTAVALFLGSLTNSVVAALGVGVFYFAGHSTEVLREMTGTADNGVVQALYAAVYRVLPNLEDVNFLNGTASGDPVHWGALAMGGLAMLCWSSVFLVGATALFRKREL